MSNPIQGYADSYRLMQRDGAKTVCIWSIITDLERNMAPLMGAAQSELAALREALADMQHWRDLALQFDNHRMTTLWHLKTLVVNPSYAPAVSEFLASPPLPASEVVQRLTAAEQRNALRDIESAAIVLANCMDYPWEHMPENGRALMRKHAKDVFDAALAQPAESGASE